ncbi:MAG: EAL domain-containing protein [Planctomycetota bacterium]
MASDPAASQVLKTAVYQRPGHILAVAADESFRKKLAGELAKQGHTVLATADGQHALDLAQGAQFDLAVVEVALPDIDGVELCRRLKANAGTRHPAVMLLAAAPNVEAQVRGLEGGASDFLSKPLAWPVLHARIVAVLEQQRTVASFQAEHERIEGRARECARELQAANAGLQKEIARRTQVEKIWRDSEERCALVERGANDGLWDWDFVTKQVHFSPRWKNMLGYGPNELKDHLDEWLTRVHPDDRVGLRDDIQVHVSGLSAHLEHEFRMLHKDGTYRWVFCRGLATKNADGQPCRMAGSQTDITERKLAEFKAAHDAFHDELTGLANRALFLDRVGQALARTRQNANAKSAVLYLGIDRFEIINDGLGFQTGNALLAAFAKRLQRCLRPTDTFARLAGEEFGVLLEDVRSLAEATALANSIHQVLTDPFQLGDREVFVTASVGIVLTKTKYAGAEDLVRDAHTAMHSAMAAGKSRQETFASGMHAQVLTQLHMENDLRQAIKGREFCLWYQPIVSLQSGRVSGFEALIRWRRPYGLVQPSDFIHLAEETELILPITAWVFHEAFAQMRDWLKQFPERAGMTVSVNASGTAFSEGHLHRQVAEALKETGIAGSSVKVELTEGVLMQHDDGSTLAILSQLKSMELGLAIDDFGTGYSNLSYMHRLPIDILKIDRSFVSSMGPGGKNSEIVRTIKALAHNLGMVTVAEGVETQQQLDQIRELGCEYGQGFLFSKPLPADEAGQLLAADPKW